MTRYITYLKTFQQYSYLLSLLVKKEVKKKYKGSFLGILWSLLNPLLHMLVLMLVFSTLFDTSIHNFPVYMLCGFLLFNFFSSSTMSSMNSMISASSLINKIYIPKYIITLSTILSNFIFFVISLIDLLAIMLITRMEITINILYVPLYLILLLLFSSGISLILATVTVFFRDVEHIYGVLLVALQFTSAIFYPTSIIPDEFQFVLQYNPILYYIEGFRDVLYSGIAPDITNILVCFILAIVSMIVGLFVFEKKQNKFILHI
ncbi:ABC transporter permease [Paenibacillus sp. YIM B09110]|uniref:ABC transporter permease n=1 Tax=Paenibacillus sp. YIM B09110 TaxID=3126102 RepID=UPI003FA7357C